MLIWKLKACTFFYYFLLKAFKAAISTVFTRVRQNFLETETEWIINDGRFV